MTRARLLAGIVTALAALALPASAVAAPASTRFAVTGFEYAFTPTVGYFAGRATGNAGDRGAWNARVVHEPLGEDSTPVTGGSFQMVTRSAAGQYDFITGAFKGGTIVTKDAGPNCTN